MRLDTCSTATRTSTTATEGARTGPRRGARSGRGYTLIEALMVLCITAVLTSAGLPSLKSFVAARTADSQIVDFTEALRFARSEAMKRGAEVTVCARAAVVEGANTGATDSAEASCRASGADWSAGWLVFVDHQHRGEFDDGDLLLRDHTRPTSAGAVTASGAKRNVTFLSTGISLRANTTVRFSPAGADAADTRAEGTKVVCVNKPGRAKVVAAATCGG